MLIIGAKGFAKEVLEVLHCNNQIENLSFYDDVNEDIPKQLFNQFTILKSEAEAEKYFKSIDNRFTIGIGTPILRKKISNKFTDLGGTLTSVISKETNIGHYNNEIKNGVNIQQGVIITNDTSIGKGVIINLNSTIGHDSVIGDFVEICPNVSVSGNCNIGQNSFIGTGAIILPNVSIGENCIVAAGSVVRESTPDNVLVAGVPAKIKKQL